MKLRYFAGLTLEEAAAALDLSERTAKRDWAYARAWLYREIARRQDTTCAGGRRLNGPFYPESAHQ